MFFELEGITKKFGGLVANSDINIRIGENEIVGLIGPNGAGKSTLFQTVQGFTKANSGKIVFKGKNIERLNTFQINRLGIACTFQHAQLFPDLNVLESVMIGAYCRTTSKKAAQAKALELIDYVGMGDRTHAIIDELNMFDRKRVELTAALATQPQLLMLDELFAGLNPTEVSEMITLVGKIHKDMKLSLFIIEHVLKVIMSICSRVYVLDYGKIIFESTPNEIVLSPAVIKAYLGEDYDASASQ